MNLITYYKSISEYFQITFINPLYTILITKRFFSSSSEGRNTNSLQNEPFDGLMTLIQASLARTRCMDSPQSRPFHVANTINMFRFTRPFAMYKKRKERKKERRRKKSKKERKKKKRGNGGRTSPTSLSSSFQRYFHIPRSLASIFQQPIGISNSRTQVRIVMISVTRRSLAKLQLSADTGNGSAFNYRRACVRVRVCVCIHRGLNVPVCLTSNTSLSMATRSCTPAKLGSLNYFNGGKPVEFTRGKRFSFPSPSPSF